jgi:hypothetical protein
MATMWLASTSSHAQPGAGSQPADNLGAASSALMDGEYQRAADIAGNVVQRSVGTPDLAEAYRVYGLALFFLERRTEAEAALLEYLKLDADASLDPTLVPPEAIVFFEDVRARHAADLRLLRPKPKRKRYRFVNLLPPLGQFQNGDRGRGWAIAITGSLLIAANVTSALLYRKWCRDSDGTCDGGEMGGTDRTSAAKSVRGINIASGIGLLGLYAYGVIDGYVGYGRESRELAQPRTAPSMSVGVIPSGDAVYFSVGGRF